MTNYTAVSTDLLQKRFSDFLTRLSNRALGSSKLKNSWQALTISMLLVWNSFIYLFIYLLRMKCSTQTYFILIQQTNTVKHLIQAWSCIGKLTSDLFVCFLWKYLILLYGISVCFSFCRTLTMSKELCVLSNVSPHLVRHRASFWSQTAKSQNSASNLLSVGAKYRWFRYKICFRQMSLFMSLTVRTG